MCELVYDTQASGALLYSLPCASKGNTCSVQISNTRTGLLTGALAHQPAAALDSIAAFELASGKLLWRGVSGSRLQGYVNGGCTAPSAPHLHLYLACTCTPPPAPHVATKQQHEQLNSERDVAHGLPAAMGEALPLSLAGQIEMTGTGSLTSTTTTTTMTRGSGSTAGSASNQVPSAGRPRPRPPRPPPDPSPGPGVCVFAVTTATGRIAFEVCGWMDGWVGDRSACSSSWLVNHDAHCAPQSGSAMCKLQTTRVCWPSSKMCCAM